MKMGLAVVPCAFLAAALSLAPCRAFGETTAVTIQSVREDGDAGNQDGSTYGKTGGLGLAPVAATLGAASCACAAVGLHMRKELGSDDEG